MKAKCKVLFYQKCGDFFDKNSIFVKAYKFDAYSESDTVLRIVVYVDSKEEVNSRKLMPAENTDADNIRAAIKAFDDTVAAHPVLGANNA